MAAEQDRVSRGRTGLRQYLRLWPVAAAAGLFAVVLSASSHAPVGRDLAANCYQCHGTQGRPVAGMPSIAGKDASSLYQTMLEYKATPEEDRNDDIMVPIARAYTDQQLWEMALYIAGVPEHGETPTAAPFGARNGQDDR